MNSCALCIIGISLDIWQQSSQRSGITVHTWSNLGCLRSGMQIFSIARQTASKLPLTCCARSMSVLFCRFRTLLRRPLRKRSGARFLTCVEPPVRKAMRPSPTPRMASPAVSLFGDQLPTFTGAPLTPLFGSPTTAFQAICWRIFSRAAEFGSSLLTSACRPIGLSRYIAVYQT